ncbi:hypothetical protein DHD32_13820 [Arenibacter sp. TNZ]|jgi:hypothetical protein|uniref:hypothetical protein n=1 Tax=Arenibacter TaxID=178469 RepID=UPI000CD41AB8|nr:MULTISPECIES: hypothetical protein [Arenibacter]MCM4172564.1 hypothetical protein [Arenibacter sp. TNZ]
MIEIKNNKKDWNNFLLRMESYDLYHTFEYHEVMKKTGEEPIIITYKKNETEVGIPFLKRKINDELFDLVSVHGYLGPVSINVDDSFDSENFSMEFQQLLREQNIVTAFSKLNPYLRNQSKILNKLGAIENIGELVYFDQQMDMDDQFLCYKKDTIRLIKKLKPIANYKFAENSEDIETFIAIYYNNLDRLKANKSFYYKKDYFETLINSDMADAKIILAIHNETGEVMAGVFYFGTKSITHIELACTNDKYYNISPIRFLYDQIRILCHKDDMKYLNMGGGSGGREGSLMKFKSCFAQNYVDFNVWKLIAIPDVYDELQTVDQKNSESNYFPKYRLNH